MEIMTLPLMFQVRFLMEFYKLANLFIYYFLFSAIDAISSKNDKEIEMGLEVVEETYLDIHHHGLAPAIIPDTLTRLSGQKSVAASIAAAQAVLTNTLSPTSHRKKKSVMTIGNGVVDTPSQSENTHYSFNKEIDQIKALGKLNIFCPLIFKNKRCI